ncbi:unnamed protein product [Gongylonema pulchrum]|uniref:Non-specific serine/threonine protein kinase n=1 Tax=Gongylonema pulchrum TaxID=637853 RepID=A0A183E7R1_9BILA|nr:unnamed protein product [Gongylonema pulchrum]
MRNRLRNAVIGPTATKASVLETLEYLGTHLAAHSPSERAASAYCLTLLLNRDTNIQASPVATNATPACSLQNIAFFTELKHRICVLISQACSVETDLDRASDYLSFLFEHADSKNLHLVAHHISCMVERLKDGTETDNIRINAVCFYERYVRDVEQNEAEWTEELAAYLPENVKKVTVCIEQPQERYVRDVEQNEAEWTEELAAHLPENVKKVTVCIEQPHEAQRSLTMISTAVSGMLQLLCSQWKEADQMALRVLLDLWFPSSGKRPKVLNAEGVELLPMWLKLKMLRTEDDRIVRRSLTMISTAVSGMLQLLCSQWKEADQMALRVLLDLWFPSSGKRPKVLNAEGVELLPMWLKLKMLRTEDDRIVRVAMDDLKMNDALKFVQSFALTSYSCTKLLAILDADETPLEGEFLQEAKKAAVFVKGYRLRGAKGGEKVFLHVVNEVVNNYKRQRTAFQTTPCLLMNLPKINWAVALSMV